MQLENAICAFDGGGRPTEEPPSLMLSSIKLRIDYLFGGALLGIAQIE